MVLNKKPRKTLELKENNVMKLSKTFLGIALSISSASVLVGAGVVINANSENIKSASATGSTGYVFIDISSAPASFEDSVYCHNWGVESTEYPGTKMTLLQDNIYYCALKNSGNTGIKFNNGSGTATGDLGFNPTTYGRLFYLNAEGTNGNWDDKTTARMDYIYEEGGPAPSSSSVRLFINNSDCGNWNSGEKKPITVIRCWGSASYVDCVDGALYPVKWFQNTGTGASELWYGYADVPADITGWKVHRANPDYLRHFWNDGPEGNVTGSFGARIWKMQESDWSWSWSATTSDENVGEVFMTKIFEAYTTCSNSSKNGWNAYPSLNANFFENATDDALDEEMYSLGGKVAFKASEHIAGMFAGYDSGTRHNATIVE